MSAPERQHVVVMGVSGCGKTTVGVALAAKLEWPFLEGDRLHPKSNVEKMSAHVPLTDDDRWPWLQAIADWIAAEEAEGRSTVSSCSSLKRRYRDLLRTGAPRVRFVHLHGPQSVLAERLAARKGHFFPPDLLASQYTALEELEPGEDHVVVDVALTPDEQVAATLRGLGLG